MSDRKVWSYEAGAGATRVVVEENKRRGGKLQMRWWDRSKTPPNWTSQTLDRAIERDERGKVTTECAAYAVAAAQEKSLELAGRLAAKKGTAEKPPLTIDQAEALITDPKTGKYPHRNQFRDELVRALRLACALWGAKTLWRDIDESHWTMLLRTRLEGLIASNRKAVRATEISVSRLITVVKWLRSAKHIPREAAPWPEKEWKEEIVKHWKGVTKNVRGPDTHQPRHTLEEGQRILRASSFDPRFELLMWLGMDLRLGQVARARRSDVVLTTGDALAAGDYGRFTVHGAGKKGGTVVALTKGQREVIDRSFAGYLADREAQFQRGDIEDYLLFPAGYVVGRVARTRGKESELSLGKKISTTKHVSGSWIRKNFHVAEKAAGVEHELGRGAYGLRRQGVDAGARAHLSPSGLQALGGWSDTKIPLSVYAERTNEAGQLEARAVRARLRGEEE